MRGHDHCLLQNICNGGVKIHLFEKINVFLAEKLGTSTSKIILGVSTSKFIPRVSASNGDNNGGKFVGGAFIGGMLVGGAFVQVCLCWRRVHSRCVYIGGMFIGGALIGGDVFGYAFIAMAPS